jgi:hypothetical protein
MPNTLAPPLVSVLMPAYNHAPYVRAAVESVLGQTYGNLELIAIDDASSDATWEVLQSFTDARLRLYRHEANRGAHATLNEALALAKGEFIAVINSDDVYYPERLQRAVSSLMGNRGLGACFSRYDFIDEAGSVVRDSETLASDFPDAARDLGPAAEALDRQELQVLSLLARNYLHTTSNLVCRREVFEHIGPFRGYRYVHDHDFFLRLCQRYPVEVLQECLLGYRFHGTNTLAESAVASVAETAAMLAEFFLTQEPKSMRQSHPAFLEVLGYLLGNLTAYGADRLVLLLVLAGTDGRQRTEKPRFLDWAADETVRYQVGILRNKERLPDDLLWQKSQTTQWWEAAQKCNAKRSRTVWKLRHARQTLRWSETRRAWYEQQVAWTEQQLAWSEEQLDWWRDKYQRTLASRIRRIARRLLDMAIKVTRNRDQ